MITPKTIVQFLFGKREAIEKIASTNASLLLGFLFIVSAGLARNYDHHILTQEPLWIGGPVAMTLFSSVLIYGFIKKFGKIKSEFTFQNYPPFLRCFAMTAPLAWLYGIPVEQFTDALSATIFNFAVLLIVSFWRVALMIRVIQVLFDFHPVRAFSLVAIPASAEMFLATNIKSISIVGIMGGMRLSESEQFLLSATNTMVTGSFLLFFIAIFMIFCSPRGDVRPKQREDLKSQISHLTWILASLVIILWLAAAKKPQSQLANIQEFRELIRDGNYEQAARFAELKSRDGFPPHQLLLPKASFHFTPQASQTLAYYDKWPTWVRSEFQDDVSTWLAEVAKEYPNDEERNLRTLYRRLESSPYLQEFADEFTPGVVPSDYFKEKDLSE